MENQLQFVSTHPSLIVLNDKEKQIAAIIYHVNQLVTYPLSAVQIEDWAKSINELLPDIDLARLKSVINDMKMGKIEWDYRKGIQNIFLAVEEQKPFSYFVSHDDRP